LRRQHRAGDAGGSWARVGESGGGRRDTGPPNSWGILRAKEQCSDKFAGSFGRSQTYEKAQKRGEEPCSSKTHAHRHGQAQLNKGAWRTISSAIPSSACAESAARHTRTHSNCSNWIRTVWQQLHEALQKNFAADSAVATLPDFVQQRDDLLRRIELTLLERGTHQEVDEQLGKMLAEAAAWLRVPTVVAAGAGVAAIVAAMTHAAIFDLTGTIAGVAALLGTVLAVFKRQQIINEFRRQMGEKREMVINGIEDHLRHAIDRFYQELIPPSRRCVPSAAVSASFTSRCSSGSNSWKKPSQMWSRSRRGRAQTDGDAPGHPAVVTQLPVRFAGRGPLGADGATSSVAATVIDRRARHRRNLRGGRAGGHRPVGPIMLYGGTNEQREEDKDDESISSELSLIGRRSFCASRR
jgi:hypothetical protein